MRSMFFQGRKNFKKTIVKKFNRLILWSKFFDTIFPALKSKNFCTNRLAMQAGIS